MSSYKKYALQNIQLCQMVGASPVVSSNKKAVVAKWTWTMEAADAPLENPAPGHSVGNPNTPTKPNFLKCIAQHCCNFVYAWCICSTSVLLLLVFVHCDSLPASIHNMRVVSSRHTPDTAVLYMFHGQSDQDQYHFYKEVVRKLSLPPRKWVFSQTFTTRMPGADRVPWQTLQNSLGLQSPFDFRCFLHIYHITHITTTMRYLWYNKPFNIKLLAAWPKGFPSCTVIQLISRLPCWTIQMSD